MNEIIEKEIYINNLNFYKVLKQLLKCKFSDKQLIYFKEMLISSDKKTIDIFSYKNLFLENKEICTPSIARYSDFSLLINLIDILGDEKWVNFIVVGLDLLSIKELILVEAKQYTKNYYEKSILEIKDKLSIKYDVLSLDIPYGKRVLSKLLAFFICDSSEFVNSTQDIMLSKIFNRKEIKELKDKFNELKLKYKISIEGIYSLIISESVNQSILSEAGSSYENRVSQTLLNVAEKLEGHSHDKNINSHEYDFKFTIEDKEIGVSAKKTLRERYKQNFEDVSLLEVDYMCLITLGIDLNEAKLNNILAKEKYFIIVSDEIFQNTKYLKENSRVLSSKNLTKENIKKLINNL